MGNIVDRYVSGGRARLLRLTRVIKAVRGT